MTDHLDGQLEAVSGLYMAVLGTVAMVDYLAGYNLLTQALGLQEPFLTVLYLGWFVALAKAAPERMEATFGG